MKSTFALLLHLVVVLFLLGAGSVDAQINPNFCTTTINGWEYDLTDLANQFTTSDAVAMDYDNNLYYYRPCQSVLNSNCYSSGYQYPGGCQRDTRRPPQYHDIGSLNTTGFGPRSQGDGSGFFIYFTNGDDYRTFDVEFVCDPDAGQGFLYTVYPTEQPQFDFHLAWNTSYACPLNNPNNNTNSTDGIQCCLYDYSGNNEVTKTLCLDTSLGVTQCPSGLGPYDLIGQWPVDECSDCFFDGATAMEDDVLGGSDQELTALERFKQDSKLANSNDEE